MALPELLSSGITLVSAAIMIWLMLGATTLTLLQGNALCFLPWLMSSEQTFSMLSYLNYDSDCEVKHMDTKGDTMLIYILFS
jgi:hypothetical protein